VAAHAVLAALFTVEGRLPELPHRAPSLIVLAPLAQGPEAVEMRYHPGRLRAGQEGRAVGPGVGELDEHYLRAIEVIADRGLQHAPGLEFGDNGARRVQRRWLQNPHGYGRAENGRSRAARYAG